MRKVKSIITDDFEHCYLCGRPAECVHHILPGAKRKASDRLGLVVPLCNDCHTMGPNAVHSSGGVNILNDLKRIAQSIYEETHSRDHWMMNVGKNYLRNDR